MTKQRDFGQARQLPSGRYQARYRLDGVWRNAPDTFTTKKGATDWLAGERTKINEGTWRPAPKGKLTFAEHAEKWLSNQSHLRPRTVELYEYLINDHLVPTFGPRPLVAIRADEVVAWFQALKAKLPGTAPKAYRLLRQLMQAAIDDGRVQGPSPVNIKGAGREAVAKLTIPTMAEAQRLADTVPVRYRAMVLLASWAGLRYGELAALTRDDIDLRTGTVSVDETVTTLQSGVRFPGPPKSEAGRRSVAIPSTILPAISAHLETVGTEPTALLFPAPEGGYLQPHNFRHRVWLPALEAAGLSYRFHDLRHCALTLAAEAGATIAELMARGGHSSAATAMRYQHASAERDRALAERMAALG